LGWVPKGFKNVDRETGDTTIVGKLSLVVWKKRRGHDFWGFKFLKPIFLGGK